MARVLDVEVAHAVRACMEAEIDAGREDNAIDWLVRSEEAAQEPVCVALLPFIAARVMKIMHAMRKDKKYRGILAEISAEARHSIALVAKKHSGHHGENRQQSKSPSLSQTRALLARLLPVISVDSGHRETCLQLVGVVETLLGGAQRVQASTHKSQ